MNKPTHDEIAQKAYQLWQERGSLHGTDTEIWFEAEHELTAKSQAPTPKAVATSERLKAEASTSTTVKAPAAATVPDQETVTAELQKAEARAPQVPHHTGPKSKPAPPGKPVWDKPHSS